MQRKITPFKRTEQEPLDPDANLALRQMAGWPLEFGQRNQHRERHHTLTIHRDHMGRMTGSVEQIEEHDYDDLNESWGK